MKTICSGVFALCVLAAAPAFAQQTPLNTICNQATGLSWEMNTEADMNKYHVYVSNAPIDITVDNSNLIFMSIPHDLSKAVINTDGTSTVTETLHGTLAEGDKYFRVSAVDNVGNESPLSLEVGCKYDLIPGTPTSVILILSKS